MNMIKRRSSFVTVIDNTWKGAISFTVFIALEFLENGFDSNFGFMIFILAVIITPILLLFQFIRWRITFFIYDGESVTLERSGIFKKKLTIPVDKISTVDIKKNILGHLTGTSRVKIDSGGKQSGKENEPEINLIFNDEFARQIKAQIFREEVETHDNTFRMSVKDLFIDGLLSRKVIYFIPLLFSIYFIVLAILGEKTLDNVTSKVVSYLGSLEFLVILLLAIFLLVFANIYAIVVELIRYHNFTLQKHKDVIVTSFGLFTTQNYSLPTDKIRAVILKQNTLFRLLGYWSVSVVCIGLGDEKNEKPVIFPLANKERLDSILSMMDPRLIVEEEKHKVPKKGRIFYYLPVIICLIIMLVILAVSSFKSIFLMAQLFVLPLLLIIATLSLKNAGLSYNENHVTTTKGVFTKTTTIIPLNHLQSVSMNVPFYKKKRNLCNLYLKYNPGFDNPHLSSFDKKHFAALAELLKKN